MWVSLLVYLKSWVGICQSPGCIVEVRLELRARASEVTDSSALAKSPVVVCLKLWGVPVENLTIASRKGRTWTTTPNYCDDDPLRKHTAFVQCTQTLRVLLESELDGGIDEAHTLGEMGRSHTTATESPNALQGRCKSCTEEYFG